jgi:hypothetical protein
MSEESTFDQAVEDIFEILGEDAVFNPSSGPPVEDCKVILDKDTSQEPGGYDAQVFVVVRTLEYRLAEVGKEADPGETFVVGGKTWTVEGPFEDPDSNDQRCVKVVVR